MLLSLQSRLKKSYMAGCLSNTAPELETHTCYRATTYDKKNDTNELNMISTISIDAMLFKGLSMFIIQLISVMTTSHHQKQLGHLKCMSLFSSSIIQSRNPDGNDVKKFQPSQTLQMKSFHWLDVSLSASSPSSLFD